MKKFVLIICTLTLSMGIFSQKYELEKTFFGLQGKIDSVQNCLFPINTPAEEIKICDTYGMDIFDENGHMSKSKYTSSKTFLEQTFARDDKGRVLNYELIKFNRADSVVTQHLSGKFTHTDDNKWEIVLMDKIKGSLAKSVEVKANPYSQMETSTDIASNGDIVVHRKKYDSKGNLLYDKEFSGDDIWIRSTHYTYNSNNQEINREYTEKGKTKIVELIKYTEFDEQGNWTRREITSKGKDQNMIEIQKIYYRE